ncbi:hypothetical protein NC651_006083 [Populus alba x Populus x berolinensis]|nr:hypothetical protein NC651_006083 [Populus alba x Populus x berolinensis]
MPKPFIGRKMHYQQSPRVFVLQKPMVILLLVLFVSGDRKEETTVNVHGLQNQQPPSSTEKQQRLRHSFDTFFSSKRKVPNASDPLHNR